MYQIILKYDRLDKKVMAKRIFWMTLVKLIYLIRVMYMYISRVINLSFNTKITFVRIAL